MLKEVLDRGVPLEFIDEKSEHRRLMQKVMATGGLNDKFIYLMAKGVYHKADAQFVQDSLNNPCIHVLILGNSGVGKTTLINTLKCFCKLDYETSIQSTTGLVPTDFIYGKYQYQFYDFAGQMEFEIIHSRFLENRLATLAEYYGQNAFVFILMVNAEKSLEENKSQIERWTIFMKKHISDQNLSLSTLLVCSHADRIENNHNKNTEVKDLLKFFLEISSHPLKGKDNKIFLNGQVLNNKVADCKSVSNVMEILESMGTELEDYSLSPLAAYLNRFINMKFLNTPVQLKILVDKVKELRSFELNGNGQIVLKGDRLLISEIPELLKDSLSELHAHNFILLMKHSDRCQYWWIVCKSMQEKLFSHASSLFIPNSSQDITSRLEFTNNTGIVSTEELQVKFKKLLLDFPFSIFLTYLKDMDYCRLIENEKLKKLNEKSTEKQSLECNNKDCDFYFFPGLITAKKPSNIYQKIDDKEYLHFGWILKANNQLGLCFFQSMIFNLTFKFTAGRDSESDLGRRICRWKNGMFWTTEDMVQALVEVRKDSEVLLLCRSTESCILAKYTGSIVHEIRNTKKKLSKSEDVSFKDEYCLLKPNQGYKPEDYDSKNEVVSLAKLIVLFSKRKERRSHYINDSDCIPMRKFLKMDPYVSMEIEEIQQLWRNNNERVTDKIISIDIIKAIVDKEELDLQNVSNSVLRSALTKYSIFDGSQL